MGYPRTTESEGRAGVESQLAGLNFGLPRNWERGLFLVFSSCVFLLMTCLREVVCRWVIQIGMSYRYSLRVPVGATLAGRSCRCIWFASPRRFAGGEEARLGRKSLYQYSYFGRGSFITGREMHTLDRTDCCFLYCILIPRGRLAGVFFFGPILAYLRGVGLFVLHSVPGIRNGIIGQLELKPGPYVWGRRICVLPKLDLVPIVLYRFSRVS